MEKIYIIKEHYEDCEGYDHSRLFKPIFFESSIKATKAMIEEKRKALEEDWEELDLYVEELTKATED